MLQQELENNQITEKLAARLNKKPGIKFISAFIISLLLFLFGVWGGYVTLSGGLSAWGINQQVSWGIAVVNFIWWIGIGHAGTLISAILYLLNQKWRMTIHRSAEAMTIFALICAVIFPVIHTGRPWLSYWLFPYPSQMGVWGNFKSPLMWDVFAILTYFIVSAMFWYLGLIPDLAALTNRIKSKRLRSIYFFLSLGWKGAESHWKAYKTIYLLLAGVATPLVISVHSIVSTDFAVALLPGWHSTIFPPYFVVGAIFSGCAMVITLMVTARELIDLKGIIRIEHLEKINKIILTCSLLILYAYLSEAFSAYYSGNQSERFIFFLRATGDYSYFFWIMMTFNVIVPQLFWLKKVRQNVTIMLVISLLVNVGMWLERYIIIVSSLAKSYMVSTWDIYKPTLIDISLSAGSVGLFMLLYLVFIKFVPLISLYEIKGENNN